MTKSLSISLCFLLIALSAYSQTLTAPESVGMSTERLATLNKAMHAYVDNGQLAGVQTAVMRKGKLVHFDTYGMSDIDSKTPLTEESIWRIYSMTKPIVSVGLMMLYEEGKFQLNDPLHKYIPEFKNLKVHQGDGKVENAKNHVKIVDILRHTSGIGYGWGGGYVDSLYQLAGRTKKFPLVGDMVKGLTEIPLYYEPGTAWRYGLSTDICGYLIEVLSGQQLDEYLQEKILTPLGMNDTHFEVPDEKDARFISNYTHAEDGTLTIIDHPSMSAYTKDVTNFSGGGGMVSTSGDYLKFCKMLIDGGAQGEHRILSPKTIELMTKDHCEGLKHQGGPVIMPGMGNGFGLGFAVVNDLAESRTLGSIGAYGWGGAAGTYFRIDPEEDLIILLMIQVMPYHHLQARERFHTLVYQAIVD